MNTIEELIDNGFDVRIYSTIKRMDVGNDRDWVDRFCWELKFFDERIESKWEGFKTVSEAIDDLLKKATKLKSKWQ